MFEQDRVLVRLQQRVSLEAQIAACYLVGSYGRGAQDSYSDLDVVLLYKDEVERDQAYQDRRSFARSILPFVSVKSFDSGSYRHIALYSNGAMVDFSFDALDVKQPAWTDRHILILKDTPDGWAHRLQSEAQNLTASNRFSSISSQELNLLDERFWILFANVYRQILRGDFQTPFVDYLRLLGSTLPAMLELLPQDEPVRLQLIKSSYGANIQHTQEHLEHLLAAYLDARHRIIEIHNLEFRPDQHFERDMQRIVKSPPVR
jgi:predicted nucleotidyltransferase